jgi:hypothetical protein
MSINLDKYRLGANPFAPADRRFRLATKCIKHGLRPSFHDDRPTWVLFQFMRKYRAARDLAQRARLRREYCGLSIAFDLHHGKGQELCPVIESYILAGTSDEEIARRLAVPTDAICWFRTIFYDIEHLRSSRLRMLKFIGAIDGDGESALDVHRLWKLAGYTMKCEGLDHLFQSNGNDSRLHGEGIEAWMSRQIRSTLRLKQFIAAHRLSADAPKHLERLIQLWVEEQNRLREAGEVSLNQYEQHAKAFIEQIPWAFGAEAEESFKDTEIGKHDAGAAELRADELLLMAAGGKVPGLDEQLSEFPPPRKRKPSLGPNDGGGLWE